MKLSQQCYEALVGSPLANTQHTPKTALALLSYLTAAGLVFGLVAWVMIENEEAIKEAFLSYLFPEPWHTLTEYMGSFFFASQTKIVIASSIIGSSLVAASLLLFPLKELCSSSFEKANFNNGQRKEFPLWLQAAEEGKLFFLYLTMQCVILAIGYYPFLWAKIISTVLSILFLGFSFGLDLISPTLQRHRIRYTQILKILLKNAPLTLLFGLLYSTPVLIIARFILTNDTLSLIQMASIIVAINLFFLALAIPAGTRVASRLLEEARSTPPAQRRTKKLGYGIMSILLVLGLTFHSRIVLSMHHKSQVLKCEYDIDWGSMDAELPTFKKFLAGKTTANLSFDLKITNPTKIHLKMEDSLLTITQKGQVISATTIKAFNIKPGESVTRKMVFDSEINAAALSKFTELLEGWSAKIEYEIMPGIPFIVQLG